ncbi:hypothetical protein [Brucella grignonensis]|uniref:Uncharacterized protein n=1 Tax=Brucella grignonensis TaxID=94627 RepID=A0A256EYA2_9HYPH|nr:hypothetical protein [Brucella grignonensis]OYR07523.1 hypothetical protein CEV33_3709 [Brucella grignonensis]
MTADRKDSGTRFAKISTEQKQIYHMLEKARSLLMLREVHSVTNDRGARADVNFCATAYLGFFEA